MIDYWQVFFAFSYGFGFAKSYEFCYAKRYDFAMQKL